MKRNTAHKLWIKNIKEFEEVYDAGKFVGLRKSGDIIKRVNIIGSVIDKFVGENFASVILDDSSGTIEIRDFDSKFEDISIGDVVVVIGRIRKYNEKLYILKEIIKKRDPLWLVARKLELEKIFGLKIEDEEDNPKTMKEKEKEGKEIKNEEELVEELLLKKIEEMEDKIGEANIENIYLELDQPSDRIKNAINKLIEEGKIYEPRPGTLKKF